MDCIEFNSARNDCPPLYATLSLAQALHESRRRGARLALECFHPKQRESTIQRRAVSPGMAPVVTFEPHSIARASQIICFAAVRSLISQR